MTPEMIERARLFHDTYERLAPQFGYTTRTDTREFNPDSPNGRLMIAAISAVADQFREEGRAEERAAIAAFMRDPETSARTQRPWFARTAKGDLTNTTRENLGVAFIHAQDLAQAIEAGEHTIRALSAAEIARGAA
jgi:DNA invertase Pin-like site-specific DNA recombinase